MNVSDNLRLGGVFVAECYGADGALKWREEVHNLVVNQGRTDILEKYFRGSSYTATWYVGLKGAGTIAAADTLASHSGWSEVNPYSGNRPAWSPSAAASNSITNSSAVAFAITGTSTVAGPFLASVNTGTSGTLFSAVDFSASRAVVSGDTLNVTYTVNA
jgi:hypothetical protein